MNVGLAVDITELFIKQKFRPAGISCVSAAAALDLDRSKGVKCLNYPLTKDWFVFIFFNPKTVLIRCYNHRCRKPPNFAYWKHLQLLKLMDSAVSMLSELGNMPICHVCSCVKSPLDFSGFTLTYIRCIL